MKIILKIKKELKDFENKIQNQKHRTFKDEDLGELTFTEEEMTMTIKDELYGIEKYFLEFQKMTFITLCYSEVEKFFDNIIDITIGKNIKLKNLKQKILRLSNYLRVDLTELISRVDTLRRIRNNIVHNYDYWDSEIIIVGEETQIEINDLENLNDEILSNILNLIIESIIEFEIEYNKKTTIIIN